MFLYQWLIKLMVDNSDALYVSIMLVVFGYCGWLLWKINGKLEYFLGEWDKHEKTLNCLKQKIDELDQSVYKDLIHSIDTNSNEIEKMMIAVEKNREDIDRNRGAIIEEIKESAAETKEIIKILHGNQARSIECSSTDDKK